MSGILLYWRTKFTDVVGFGVDAESPQSGVGCDHRHDTGRRLCVDYVGVDVILVVRQFGVDRFVGVQPVVDRDGHGDDDGGQEADADRRQAESAVHTAGHHIPEERETVAAAPARLLPVVGRFLRLLASRDRNHSAN